MPGRDPVHNAIPGPISLRRLQYAQVPRDYQAQDTIRELLLLILKTFRFSQAYLIIRGLAEHQAFPALFGCASSRQVTCNRIDVDSILSYALRSRSYES